MVTGDIIDNVVAVGLPAKILSNWEEFMERHKSNMKSVYMVKNTLGEKVCGCKKRIQQRHEIGRTGGHVD